MAGIFQTITPKQSRFCKTRQTDLFARRCSKLEVAKLLLSVTDAWQGRECLPPFKITFAVSESVTCCESWHPASLVNALMSEPPSAQAQVPGLAPQGRGDGGNANVVLRDQASAQLLSCELGDTARLSAAVDTDSLSEDWLSRRVHRGEASLSGMSSASKRSTR